MFFQVIPGFLLHISVFQHYDNLSQYEVEILLKKKYLNM